MAKPKRSTGGSGLRKNHGPKKKMFHSYPKAIRIALGKCGALRKEYDEEALAQSEVAKGLRRK